MAKETGRRSRAVSLTLLSAALALTAALLFGRRFPSQDPDAPAAPAAASKVEFDRFSARVERDDQGERLSVSLRLRTTANGAQDCFAFVVARNDSAAPRHWSIWPPQPPGPAITAGGHFHGTDPSSGFGVTLTDDWQRITATVPTPAGVRTFDTVVVYVLDGEGEILLARPFRV
jgi:hypothetical protein